MDAISQDTHFGFVIFLYPDRNPGFQHFSQGFFDGLADRAQLPESSIGIGQQHDKRSIAGVGSPRG
ncbi:MAG: hypothetical protein IJJ13_09875 [Lachnospiraceae bacterium]|nr:hypothetical protein [Lachnospiraceae bacterium]